MFPYIAHWYLISKHKTAKISSQQYNVHHPRKETRNLSLAKIPRLISLLLLQHWYKLMWLLRPKAFKLRLMRFYSNMILLINIIWANNVDRQNSIVKVLHTINTMHRSKDTFLHWYTWKIQGLKICLLRTVINTLYSI